MLLKTSRTQVDRLLDPKNDITLGSLQRAAAMVGRRVFYRTGVGMVSCVEVKEIRRPPGPRIGTWGTWL